MLVLLAIWLVASLGASQAAEEEIWVFYHPDIPLYADTLKELIARHGPRLVPCPVGRVSASFLESRSPRWAIALGDTALQRALAMPWQVPILGVFIDQTTVDPRVMLLEVKQPHELQFATLLRLQPAISRIWYPYTTERFAPGPSLQRAAANARLQVVAEQVSDPRRLPEALRQFADPAMAVLLPPDPGLMNSAFLDALFLAAFRSHTLVIGFSESLVRQGAAFAFVMTPANLATALSEILQDPPSEESWPGPTRLFHRWNLAINRTVLGKLGLEVPADLLASASRLF
jgi:hypothetical protein